MNIVWLSGSWSSSNVVCGLSVLQLLRIQSESTGIYTLIYLSTRVTIPGLHLKGLTISTLDVNKPFCSTIDLYSCRRRQSGARIDVIRRCLRCGNLSKHPIDVFGIWRSCANSFDQSVNGLSWRRGWWRSYMSSFGNQYSIVIIPPHIRGIEIIICSSGQR
jgi:hypothetical protein